MPHPDEPAHVADHPSAVALAVGDGDADIFTGMEALPGPPAFLDGFPAPAGATLVLAQRERDGDAEHAAWRADDGPIAGYLSALREYGCAFGDVPRLITARLPGSTRYTLWREGAGGNVTRHGNGRYVSVVWKAAADRPANPVEPSEAPDTRPLPVGLPAAREVAAFLAPPGQEAGFVAVMSLATASHHLSRRENQLGNDPELVLVRHVALTMVANLIATGRRPRPRGLTLVPDETGLLEARNPDRTFETRVAITRGGRMAGEALSGLSTAPDRVPPGRYGWLFEGLTAGRLEATSEACWRMVNGSR